MPSPEPAEVARFLRQMEEGDPHAFEELLPHVYKDLRKLADRMLQDQFRNHTLQPTALVHEAYLRLAKGQSSGWESRRHFMSVASLAMRQLLRDYARDRNAQKRSAPGNASSWRISPRRPTTRSESISWPSTKR